jgi:pimeloyl-ACP methyl ester carboxylesterase
VSSPAIASKVQFANIKTNIGDGSNLVVEYQWLNEASRDAPVAVFLHEGLGSLDMWGDWPQKLCDRLNFRGLVYSRPGYGRSTPYFDGRRWPVDYHVEQVSNILPNLLDAAGVTESERQEMWVIGHSDGATIALLYAAMFPNDVGHVVSIGPHIFVEDLTIDGVIAAGRAYSTTPLRDRLSRYHDDVDAVFYGWHDTWSSRVFQAKWNIVDQLAQIRAPLLLVQGSNDTYGSMSQIHAISGEIPHAKILAIPNCDHWPHREATNILNDGIAQFALGKF